MAKQHYERFNQYIKFQTKSSNVKDPIVKAIELFEHTLDKKALVWFQEHKDKFVDITTLKTMFLQRYNPWGKTKRDQLQSWNILTFDPQKTDVDEHIDLINTLGNMLGQTAESKMEKFIDTMPTIIQTHLITCENWAKTAKRAKELEHIIRKCDPLVAALPTLMQDPAVPCLYSHIAHSNDKEETDIPQPFKGARPKQTKTRGRGKGKQPQQKPNPLQYRYKKNNTLIRILIITTTMTITEINPEAIDLIEANILDNFSEVKILMVDANIPKTHTKFNIKVTNIKVITTKAIMVYTTTQIEAINYGKFRGRSHSHRSNYHGRSHGRSNYRSNDNYQYHQCYGHDDDYQPDQYGPPCALCGGYNHSPKHYFKGEHDINNIY